MGAKKAEAKAAKKAAPATKTKKEGGGGGKAKKKATYDKLYKEVPSYKLITPSVVSERLKVRGSLAKQALRELHSKGLIRLVSKHSSQLIYTRTTKATDE
ncbi:hypothetical protein C0Q70_12173 [Pomacea canaliculata]|uniref:40S ribosomal protein S25 n=1 Tax=Pomacea canaliculata TaxID=400727 RepID=A0A2T7P0T9_POMCA|nr:hypothetical protein C0Q70_12173 [Pomacea canaliculata]